MNDQEWYLEGLLGKGRRWVIRIEPIPFFVGRQKECHLALSSKEVSRNHAEIFVSDGRLQVRDLNSTNGTFVNRRRLERDTPVVTLADNDIIHFGDLEFRVTSFNPEHSAEATGEVTSFNLRTELPAQQFVTCANEFDAMLRENAVLPVYQAVVELAPAHRTLAYEVLGRGNYPGVPESPGPLFGIAEQLQREVELSDAFRRAGVARVLNLANPPRLFVNTHPAEMDFMGLLKAMQDLRAMAPNVELVLEISEQAAANADLMRRLRESLNMLDMGLAYDDFGAGQARLNELIKVPPDYLKFDLTLIRDIHLPSEKARRRSMKTLVEMAKDLGVITLSEGIENAEEAEVCTDLGFDTAQGYFFGRPRPWGE